MMLKTSRVLWGMTIEFGDWELFWYMPGYTRISLDAWAELPFLYVSCRHLFFYVYWNCSSRVNVVIDLHQ